MNLFVIGGILDSIKEGVYWLFLQICYGVYLFIGALYQVFEKTAKVNLFSEEIFDKITGRLYVVIGIAMLFIFAYNIVLAIVNPDGKDKGTTNLAKSVKETIISLVIIVLLPTIFNYLYIFQNHILESNIIGTIVLGGVGSTSGIPDTNQDGVRDLSDCEVGDYDCTCNFSKLDLSDYGGDSFSGWDFLTKGLLGGLVSLFSDNTISNDKITTLLGAACVNYRDNYTPSQRGANSVAPTIFSAFYRPAKYTFNECIDYLDTSTSSSFDNSKDQQLCTNYVFDTLMSKYTGSLISFTTDDFLIEQTVEGNVEFNFFMAIVAGILALYMFFCYAMEVGVRVAKLGFLQIISPIPVMMRIVPGQKEKIYDKWFTQLKNTYLDVFIRLLIIFFILFAVSLVPEVVNTLFGSIYDGESVVQGAGVASAVDNFIIKSLVTVFVILGLLKFDQDAPKLLKEFFGGLGEGTFALRNPVKQLTDNKFAMGGMGAIGGAASAMVKNYNNAKKNGKSSIGSAAAGAGSGLIRGARAGYKSQNFKELKTNTGGAIDRTLQARDDRDYRNRWQKLGPDGTVMLDKNGNPIQGAKAYYANRFADSMNNWLSGESLESLKRQRDVTRQAFTNHKKIMDDTKKTIVENPSKYTIIEKDEAGNIISSRSIYELELEKNHAASNLNNFDISKYIDDLKNGIIDGIKHSEEEAGRLADKRQEELLKAAANASKRYDTAVDSLTEAVIAHTEIAKTSRGEWVQKEMEMIDEKGETFKADFTIKTDKEVSNLSHLIDVAANDLSTHATEIGADIMGKAEIQSGSIKQKRNVLGDKAAALDAEIAKKAEQQNSSKK